MSNHPNPPAVIEEDKFTVRRTIRIAAGIEKVWAAVTQPEYISRWFGETILDGTDAGARGTITWPGRNPVPLAIEAIEPPASVTYRWANNDRPGDSGETLFTFTLEELDAGTQLTVVEIGFDATGDPAFEMRSHRDGWIGELDKLVALLEHEK